MFSLHFLTLKLCYLQYSFFARLIAGPAMVAFLILQTSKKVNCITIANIHVFSYSFHSRQVPKTVLAEMHALKNKQTNVFHWIYDNSINRQLFRLYFSFVLRRISVTMKLYITLQVNIDCLPNLPCIKIMPRTSSIIFQLPMVLEFTLIIAAGFCESCFNFAFFNCVLQALKVDSRFFLKKASDLL